MRREMAVKRVVGADAAHDCIDGNGRRLDMVVGKRYVPRLREYGQTKRCGPWERAFGRLVARSLYSILDDTAAC